MKILATAEWHAHIAAMMDAVGEVYFYERVIKALEFLTRNEDATILLLSKDQAPAVLLDNLTGVNEDLFRNRYLTGLYVVSPFYQAFVKGMRLGVITIDDVAPEGFRRSEYFKGYYEHVTASEMLVIVVPAANDGAIMISLGRPNDAPKFGKQDKEKILTIAPIIERLFRMHLKRLTKGGEAIVPAVERVAHTHYRRVLEEFGRADLTNREAEVVQLLLRGHSAKSAGRDLGLSPETVRVHLKHAYAKLRVQSQAELFASFVNALVNSASLPLH